MLTQIYLRYLPFHIQLSVSVVRKRNSRIDHFLFWSLRTAAVLVHKLLVSKTHAV